MLLKILILVVVTFIPFLELRASIPLGILLSEVKLLGFSFQGFGLNWVLVFWVCVLSNIVLGPLVYVFLDKFADYFLKYKIFSRYYNKKIEKTQKKISPYVNKYGVLGVALFIGTPLPGTGSYTGALGSYLLGIGYKKFIIANTIGVFIAGIAVTAITLVGLNLFNFIL
jgi:uncharacterized membrane protein